MIKTWIIYLSLIIFISLSLGRVLKCNNVNGNNNTVFSMKKGINIKVLAILCISIFPIIIGGLRYDVGRDYFSYYYGIINYSQPKRINFMDEIGSKFIQYISSEIFNSPAIYFFITTAIIILTILYALYRVSWYVPVGYSIFMFLCMEYAPSLNIVRQYMAVGIVLLAYTYMQEKKFKTFLILVLIAFSFHTSAIVVMPIYLIATKKYGQGSKKIILIISILAVVAYRPLMNLAMSIGIGNAYEVYLSNYSSFDSREIIIPIIKFIPIMLIISVYRKRLIKYNQSNVMYIYMIFIGFILQLTAINGPFIERISLYFSICQIIVLPQIIKMTSNKAENLIIKIFIIGYGLMYFIIYYGILNYASIFPYKSILSI